MIPAKAVPKPKTTKSAGSAQHTNVPKEVNRLKKAKTRLMI